MSSLKKKFLFILFILIIHHPFSITAQEKSNDDGELLITTVPIIAAGVGRKFNDCMEEMRLGCENTYNYCMMSVQKK